MKHLLSLMEEFSILGTPPAPIDGEEPLAFSTLMQAPPAPVAAPEEEYELDAEGNPVLDAQGNPIKKLGQSAAPAAPGSCTCAHGEPGVPAPVAPGAVAPVAPPAMPPIPQDEFDFNV